MKQNPPKKHHYIPEFYLKRWRGADDQIRRYIRRNNTIQKRLVQPAGTGYVEKLYSLEGFPEAQAQIFETEFFKPVDGLAAEALALMERDGNNVKWDIKRRSAWSRFLFSLLMRCPEDLETFKRTWKHLLREEDNEEWEEKYKQIKTKDNPATFQEFIDSLPVERAELISMQAFIGLIDNQNIGQKLNTMHWHVLSTNGADYNLLTSDRPIIMTNGILRPDGHIALPIGPRKLFLAAQDIGTIDKIIQPHSSIQKQDRSPVVAAALPAPWWVGCWVIISRKVTTRPVYLNTSNRASKSKLWIACPQNETNNGHRYMPVTVLFNVYGGNNVAGTLPDKRFPNTAAICIDPDANPAG